MQLAETGPPVVNGKGKKGLLMQSFLGGFFFFFPFLACIGIFALIFLLLSY